MNDIDALFNKLASLSRSQLLEGAIAADRHNTFPVENVECIRKLGLFGSAVPADEGGLGLSVEQLSRTALILGKGCLSTALIWSMHSQQLSVLCRSRSSVARKVLQRVTRDGVLIASVTSEVGKGADLFRALAPLEVQEDGRVAFRRLAPTVSYGREAAYYLITMRADCTSSESEVRFVIAGRDEGTVDVRGEWNAMGVHGTQSIPLSLDMSVAQGAVLPEAFRPMVLNWFVPHGQILWSASWLGAAQGAFERLLEHQLSIRAALRTRLHSDLYIARVADIEIRLLAANGMLNDTIMRYQDSLLRAENELDMRVIEGVNALKVYVSEQVVAVLDLLMQLAGLSKGYLHDPDVGIERVYRDVLSARLMFSNDELRRSIGFHAMKRWM